MLVLVCNWCKVSVSQRYLALVCSDGLGLDKGPTKAWPNETKKKKNCAVLYWTFYITHSGNTQTWTQHTHTHIYAYRVRSKIPTIVKIWKV